jgi:hypothetical protein
MDFLNPITKIVVKSLRTIILNLFIFVMCLKFLNSYSYCLFFRYLKLFYEFAKFIFNSNSINIISKKLESSINFFQLFSNNPNYLLYHKAGK